MENFLIQCYKAMLEGCFWLAVQTNRMKDVGRGFSENWKKLVQQTKERLKATFFIPSLPRNLRNTEEVFNVIETFKSDADLQETQVTNTFDTQTGVSSCIHTRRSVQRCVGCFSSHPSINSSKIRSLISLHQLTQFANVIIV